MTRLSNSRTIALMSAIAIVTVIFAINLYWRLDLASEVTGARSEIVTAQLYAWLQNWVAEGPFSIHFMMPYFPLSIESPGLQFRDELYRSYPPGALVPVYLLSRLYGAAPITLLTGYGLAGHAVVVAAVACAVFVVAEKAVRSVVPQDSAGSMLAPALLAVSAGIFLTVAYGPSYFFARVYVWDVAVLPWFALALLLDAIYTSNLDSPRAASRALVLQMAVFTVGIWTDWLMVIVIFVWIAMRVAEHWLGIKGAISAWRAASVATAIFLANMALIFAWRILAGIEQAGSLTVFDELKRTLYKLIYRAGLTNEDPITAEGLFQQIKGNLITYFSISLLQFLVMLVASALCVAMSFALLRRLKLADSLWPLVSLAVLSTIPPVAYLCLLPQHAYFHDFTILKFAFPISLLILTLAPLATAVLATRVAQARFKLSPRTGGTVLAILVCGPALAGIYFSMTRFDIPQRHFPPVRGGIGALGTVIGRNVEYADIVFSPQIEIQRMSAEAGFSRKLVYRSSDVERDLPAVAKRVCTPFNLVIVSTGSEAPARATPPSEVVRDSGLTFYRWRNVSPKECITGKS